VLRSYWERPDATAEAFTEDGWFRTGDLGQFDPDGYLRIVGRSKELIIAGGFNVYPREVEETLAAHELVREAAVVGQPHLEWGETVVAYVVLQDGDLGADEPNIREALFAHAAEHLAKYKRPREIHFRTELPRNALGKIIRSELHISKVDTQRLHSD
jgi:malonyl-CoA/methylmalonyl-CoA synthetase